MSAQVDRFVHDRLPPAEQLPMLRYDLPELQLPDQLNLVEELLDKAAARPWADRPMLRSPARTLSYAEAATELSGYNLSLEASYKAYSKVSNLSLFSVL